MVPAATGMPSGRPLRCAPSAVMCPITSVGHFSSGIGSPGAMSSTHFLIQRFLPTSYSGSE